MIEPDTLIDGRYRIVRLVGEGGMASVYEAERPVIGARVAIKVLHAHHAKDAVVVRRFTREARAAAEIGHPNIVEVLDVGTHENLPFLVMELLRGETLREAMARREKIPADEVCAIVGRVLSALDAAHAIGIVHRDIKPENVFLAEKGGEMTVKLLDFGALKFHRDRDGLYDSSQTGMPLGTPGYMAPEQWMALPDIDARADVFSVGVMLYEALTRAMPFSGDSQGGLFLEVVRGTAVPTAPSGLVPWLPDELDAVVLRALLRDRDARFSSARAFLDALRPFSAYTVSVSMLPAAVPNDAPTQPDSVPPSPKSPRAPRWLWLSLGIASLVGLAWSYGVLTRSAPSALPETAAVSPPDVPSTPEAPTVTPAVSAPLVAPRPTDRAISVRPPTPRRPRAPTPRASPPAGGRLQVLHEF